MKIKSVVVTSKQEIKAGLISRRSKKGAKEISKMNAEYKDFQSIPANTVLVIREGWRGEDGEDRVYIHGAGWFKTDKKNGVTLESVFAIKSEKASFDSLFPKDHCFENIKDDVDKVSRVIKFPIHEKELEVV